LKSFAIAIVLLILGCRCYGQTSAAYVGCVDNSKTQAELNQCASDEAARADAELNTSYRRLLRQIAGDSLDISKLEEAERAWRRYRDAYIEAVYPAQDKQATYGTEYPMNVNLLRAKLTREHTAAIAYISNEYQPTK